MIKDLLVTIFGILLGITISFYPSKLIDERDKNQKIGDYWALIDYETTIINNKVNSHISDINAGIPQLKKSAEAREANRSNEPAFAGYIFNLFPDNLWKTCLQDPDFLKESNNNNTFKTLSAGYNSISTINQIIQVHTIHSATSRLQRYYFKDLILSHEDIRAFEKDKLLLFFNKSTSNQIMQLKNMYHKRASDLAFIIDLLMCAGIVISIIVLVVFFILVRVEIQSFIGKYFKFKTKKP